MSVNTRHGTARSSSGPIWSSQQAFATSGQASGDLAAIHVDERSLLSVCKKQTVREHQFEPILGAFEGIVADNSIRALMG